MFETINNEIKNLSEKLYTGHVKFGIEHGLVTSIAFSTKNEQNPKKLDWEHEICSLFPESKDIYGSIEFDFSFGKLNSCNYVLSLRGEDLANYIRANSVKKCRTVKIVAKK